MCSGYEFFAPHAQSLPYEEGLCHSPVGVAYGLGQWHGCLALATWGHLARPLVAPWWCPHGAGGMGRHPKISFVYHWDNLAPTTLDSWAMAPTRARHTTWPLSPQVAASSHLALVQATLGSCHTGSHQQTYVGW